ncbi:HEAT repeat domain-containing protein [Calothrix sp. FACHB-1219]|uniref:HEAT repeat domain-containing protein n=1 Tax=Calothrix sp. FACHB-1219 TaxID=2692778 RepID=UPI001687B97B|nr:HEAT repeat domain-containing protein [Calothrix sp. FACHB-1219]MBD2216764.1 HEAT repeat domain-containing protein [Calothrix sp. FACHB-1219]
MVNWTGYLESLCNDDKYVKWWDAYTLTDVIGKQRVEREKSPFLLDFMVETVKPAKGEPNAAQEKTERLDVLEGLRKYAKEHVLLVGRPGSGKSTSLARLLLEEAEKARSPLNPPFLRGEVKSSEPPFLRGAGGIIPVLVELRYYQTSILDLIQDFCKRHRLLLDTTTIEQLLFAGDLLLLIDGINELPSEAARQDLYKFRQDYQKTTPMIFTTRDLGVGGDLGITKKLEMQPLTAEQMQQFVCAYLPEQGEQMLQHLGDRLREFGETPLLLWMLCSLFDPKVGIPPNLGLVFREFTQNSYKNLKQDILVKDETWDWWFLLLQHLAFRMTKGDKLTELNVAIPKSEVEKVLTEFLKGEKFDPPRDHAFKSLRDLLKYHLIQLGANEQIEFRHQLIQEYYTAECLLKQLPNLSDDCLKREYLNYLKWTEPLVLMLELLDNEAPTLRVVKLALEVDWQLGARLAGAVKSDLQQQTVNLVAELEIPLLFKIRLLGLTKSEQAIPGLIKLLEDEDYSVRIIAAEALGEIKSEQAIPGLIKLLEDEDSDVRIIAAKALGEIKSEQAIPGLIKLLEHEDSDVRSRAAEALVKIKSEQAIPGLIKLLEDEDSSVRITAAYHLKKIKSEQAIPGLIKLLEDEDSSVRSRAAEALGEIKSEQGITGLIKFLEDEDSYVRSSAAYALGEIKSEQGITGLIKLLEDEDYSVRIIAASALGEIKSEQAIPGLIQLLEHEDSNVRDRAEQALREIKSEQAIPGLIKLLEHEDSDVCSSAASALGKIKSEQAIPGLIQLLEDEDSDVRSSAAEALGKIKSEQGIPGLIQLLEDEDSDVRSSAAYALGEIKYEQAIPGLIKLLEDEDSEVRYSAADALVKIKSEQAIPGLIKLLEDEDSEVRYRAAKALGKIKSEQAIPGLIKLLEDEQSWVRYSAAYALVKIKSEQGITGLIKLLEDEQSWVRRTAAEALVKIKSEQAIPGLIKLLEDEDSYVRRIAAKALGEIKSEQAIPELIKLLEHEDSDVRCRAADALGEIKSEQAIPGLIKLLEEEDFWVRSSAASALGKIKSEQAILQIMNLLRNEEFVAANNGDTLSYALQALEAIQENCKYYNYTMSLKQELIDLLLNFFTTVKDRKTLLSYLGFDKLIKKVDLEGTSLQFTVNLVHVLEMEGRAQLLNFIDSLANSDFLGIEAKEQLNQLSANIRAITADNWRSVFADNQLQPKLIPSPITQSSLSSTINYILHLSDLHFTTPNQAQLWSNQLASDLLNELKIPHLDTLILSGDIANYSTPEEYQIAEEFLTHLRQEFTLKPEQIIIVPGNHDLNWKISEEEGYTPVLRKKYQGSMDENHVIDDGGNYIAVVNPENYKRRFENFSNFYQTIKGKPYPLEYDKQYTLDYFPNQNLLILGLNSAWQLDHHYKSRASINMNALSNALTEIRRNPEYRNCIKIAVWHHPLDSAWDDRIKDQGFIEQLAVSGFRFFLHGHIHKAETSQFRYDLSANGRKLDRICAGTFGAPVREWVSGYPLQYNLLKFAGDKLTVNTRRREELNGAWKPDARWLMGAAQNPLPYYEIPLA